jgi:ADP-heptose:LPS heptosyltransferase
LNQKILIIRFSSIGDIVLTTPVIRCIKTQLPGVTLHYLTKPAFANILSDNPYLDKVHVLDCSPLQKGLSLQQEQYDYVIDLHHNLRTLILKKALGVPAFSFPKLNIEKFLMVNFKYPCLPDEHIVQRYLAPCKHIGVSDDGEGLEYYIAPSVQTETILDFNLYQTPYIAWAVGAQHYTKRLPNHKIIEKIQAQGHLVVLLGGKEDAETGEQISKACGHRVMNMCGKISLAQSAWIVKNAQQVHTNDTGLMHIAAAFKKPIVSYWGNTLPAFGMTPYYGKDKALTQQLSTLIENKEVSCRPCSKIGHKACPKGHFNCMESL